MLQSIMERTADTTRTQLEVGRLGRGGHPDKRLILGLAAALLLGSVAAAAMVGALDRRTAIEPLACDSVERLLERAEPITSSGLEAVQAPVPSGRPAAGSLTVLGGGLVGEAAGLADPSVRSGVGHAFWDKDTFSWSPNGAFLVGTVARSPVWPECSEVVIVSADGRHLYRIAPTVADRVWVPLGWSPDGRTIAATTWTMSVRAGSPYPGLYDLGSLRLLSVDGSAPRDLGRPCDGCEIGEYSSSGAFWQITDLHGPTHKATDHAWSPDGTHLTVKFRRPQPDGQLAPEFGIATVSIVDGSWHIVAEPTVADLTLAGWRDDGSLLVQWSGASILQGGFLGQTQLLLIPSDGSATTPLTSPGQMYLTFMSPDLTSAAVVYASPSYDPQIFVVDDLASDVSHVVWQPGKSNEARHVIRLVWSPDSQQLAFEIEETGEIWVVDRDGSGLHRVGVGLDLVGWQPSWQ